MDGGKQTNRIQSWTRDCSSPIEYWIWKIVSKEGLGHKSYRGRRGGKGGVIDSILMNLINQCKSWEWWPAWGLKFNFVLIQFLAILELMSRFSAIFSASLLNRLPHSTLIPPKVENTSGVNEPCSTWRTRIKNQESRIKNFLWTT